MANWGGPWTIKKKKVIAQYLKAYQTALKKTIFEKWYVDAFAGEGYHYLDIDDPMQLSLNLNSYEEAPLDPNEYLKYCGSPILALQTNPPFDQYIFIELSKTKCKTLNTIIDKYGKDKNIITKTDDANNSIREICNAIKGKKGRCRCVLFLDPYGLAVSWETLNIISKTKGIDLWYLFPTGAIKRMLLHDRDNMEKSWAIKLDDLFGTNTWREKLYTKRNTKNEQFSFLRDKDIPKQKLIPATSIEIQSFILKRMNTIFPFVSDEALSLYNSKGFLLFSLIFAMSNSSEKALKLAKRISQSIIKLNKEG